MGEGLPVIEFETFIGGNAKEQADMLSRATIPNWDPPED